MVRLLPVPVTVIDPVVPEPTVTRMAVAVLPAVTASRLPPAACVRSFPPTVSAPPALSSVASTRVNAALMVPATGPKLAVRLGSPVRVSIAPLANDVALSTEADCAVSAPVKIHGDVAPAAIWISNTEPLPEIVPPPPNTGPK